MSRLLVVLVLILAAGRSIVRRCNDRTGQLLGFGILFSSDVLEIGAGIGSGAPDDEDSTFVTVMGVDLRF